MRENILKDKSFKFAVRIIRLCRYLQSSNEFIISRQLLRCGTSVGANIREGEYSISKADFIHKLSIAQKEANETLYWLELLFETGYIDDKQNESITSDATEILKIITASITTAKESK